LGVSFPEFGKLPSTLANDGGKGMPTVLRRDGWRFYFYSNEGTELCHIHIESQNGIAKFWLEPVSLVGSVGLRPLELRRMERAVAENREILLRAWHEHFGN